MDERNDGKPQVMLGDFNTGPDGDSIFGEFPDNFQVIEDEGFRSANIDSGNTFCTWCREENVLIPSYDPTPTSAIDHIFTRNTEASNTRRIFDEPTVLQFPDGSEASIPFSDHFGILTTVTFIP